MKKTKFGFVSVDAHGNQSKLIELTEKEYADIERALQWPEDLAAYDRLNAPIKATLEGWII